MDNLMLPRGGTMCFSQAGLAEGSGDAGIAIAASNGAGVDYCIDGILYHKADAANVDPTECTEQALATTCLYLVTLNSSGTLDTIKGTEVANADLSAGKEVLQWPMPAANTCPIGAIKIAAGTTAFQLGVDDITDDIGTGTVTFINLACIPSAPVTS